MRFLHIAYIDRKDDLMKLKPCPFCGCGVKINRGSHGLDAIVCIDVNNTCAGSKLMVLFLSKNEATAVNAWNTRAGENSEIASMSIEECFKC